MKKWIWSFGCGTKYAKKYVVVICKVGDGREYMFSKYGKENCAFSYPYEQGKMYSEQYGWECIEVVTL